ncbi:MAG: hypothetical protein JWO69_4, partial [Thermoleophilia bacterium]|nr:hypothetical protein [Thermoleophilia bacterium]
RASAIGAAAATLGAAGVGWLTAQASARTVTGWSSSAKVLVELPHRDSASHELSYSEAVHDGHWFEIDAEAVARPLSRGDWKPPADGEPVTGRTPEPAGRNDLRDRIDWGLTLPLIVGLPAAGVAGGGVVAARVGTKLLDSTVRKGQGPVEAVRTALRLLGSSRSGLANSLAVGAAVTLAPLVIGGLAAPVVGDATDSKVAGRVTGAVVGAVASGVLVGVLNRGRHLGAGMGVAQVAAGATAGAALGLLSGGVATDAVRPHPRTYDTSAGPSGAVAHD